MGIKRKGTISINTSTVEGSKNQIEAGLVYIKSSLKTAMNEARLGGDRSESNRLMEWLEDIYDTVAPMSTKRGILRFPPIPLTKKLRDELVTGPVDRGRMRPKTVDVGTDTVLTPNWWESEQKRRKKESSRRRAAKAGAQGPSAVKNHTDTGAESAMETDGEGWREVVGRKTTTAPPSGKAMGLPLPRRTGAKLRAKLPAVLVKVAAGSSYADTVRAVRHNSELN